MTEVPVVVSTNEVTVAGHVTTVELQVSMGGTGRRGSRMFSGTIAPTSLPISDVVFGGVSEFVLGDMFFVTQGTDMGSLWEYSSQPGGNSWVEILPQFGPPPYYTGTGTPNGVISAPPGSLYTNLSGGANTTLYVKESGTGNTGWVAK